MLVRFAKNKDRISRVMRRYFVELSTKKVATVVLTVTEACRLAAVLCVLLVTTARSAEWTWEWTPAPGESAPVAAICPLKYDKRWACTVEIDDGPVSTLSVSPPLLAQFQFTDAPPGVPGGKALPFVGGAAVYVLRINTGNDTCLNWEQLRELQIKGWGIINHSYWHSGNHWDPSKYLSVAQIRRELYWSQALLAAIVGKGRCVGEFVYPSGDFHYETHLDEFGLRGASLVGGKTRNLLKAQDDLKNLDRNYLDEEVWAKGGDVMQGFPDGGPSAGDLIIDFTHGMNPDPASVNHRRWQERLQTIASKYARAGSDSVWSAPTGDIVDYVLAARAVQIQSAKGRVKLSLPESAPGSALTIKLSGISTKSPMTAPSGGTLYRREDQVWITTPFLGQPGSTPPKPRLQRVYQGEVKNLTWEKPVAIAGVRLRQMGEPAKDFRLAINVTSPSDTIGSLVPDDQRDLGAGWGLWLLFPVVPDHPPLQAKELRVTPDQSLKEMEVWAVSQ